MSTMSVTANHLIFVYGTLKKGEPNYDLIEKRTEGMATFIGNAKTVKKWPLVIASRYNIPYLLYCEGKGMHVVGEVYEVDDTMLTKFDELECYPVYYTRLTEEVQLISENEGKILKPWIYFLKNFRHELLDLPYLSDYSSEGSHGLKYVSRWPSSASDEGCSRMSDGEVDIRLLALRRQQTRRKSGVAEHQGSDTNGANYIRSISDHSAYEATPIKAYSLSSESPRTPKSGTPKRKSYLSTLPVPIFDDDVRIGRMHVPPVIKCECNGFDACALISTSETVSSISADFVRKLRLVDQVIPEPSHVYNPLALHHPELKGKVKYIDLTIGSWQQVAQFDVVENYVSDITLGIDFLRKTQSVINFEEAVVKVGGNKGERIPFLTTREIMTVARRNINRPTSLIMSNGFKETD